MDGPVTGLATLATIDARLSLAGGDLAKLGDALRISLPATSPYKLAGQLHRQGDEWRFANFTGTVGESDLGGEFTVDMGKDRPVLGGKLHSKLLDIKDLGGFVGAAPGDRGAQDLGQGAAGQRDQPGEAAARGRAADADRG